MTTETTLEKLEARIAKLEELLDINRPVSVYFEEIQNELDYIFDDVIGGIKIDLKNIEKLENINNKF